MVFEIHKIFLTVFENLFIGWKSGPARILAGCKKPQAHVFKHRIRLKRLTAKGFSQSLP